MHNYLSGVLMLLLLAGTALLGLTGYGVYDADRMVQSALLQSQVRLAADGGVSPAVVRLVRQRISADGGDVGRLRISGSPAGAAAGTAVTLTVAYDYPYVLQGLAPGGSVRRATFHIHHTATMISGYRP